MVVSIMLIYYQICIKYIVSLTFLPSTYKTFNLPEKKIDGSWIIHKISK